MIILGNFQNVSPRFRVSQKASLQWLARAHSLSEALRSADSKKFAEDVFQRKMALCFARYGCSPEQIKNRGTEVPDFTHENWDKMELYSHAQDPHGPTMGERTSFFQKVGRRIGKKLFPPTDSPPDYLIHVTCTGYVSPSCAQELVVRNLWQGKTVVLHAYHMGCYAALPASLMAKSFLALNPGGTTRKGRRVDIFHTEFCSGHVQTFDHSPEQLVVQSLFADGFIRYSVFPEDEDRERKGPGLSALAFHEVLVPDTGKAITWDCSEWGMKMGLSREVPDLIAANLEPFLKELGRRADISPKALKAEAIFALHPGGPKIIDQIQSSCHLADEQVRFSRHILKEHGNMSSATLPHVWQAMCADATFEPGRPVVSLAFGPGFCISGAIFQTVA